MKKTKKSIWRPHKLIRINNRNSKITFETKILKVLGPKSQ